MRTKRPAQSAAELLGCQVDTRFSGRCNVTGIDPAQPGNVLVEDQVGKCITACAVRDPFETAAEYFRASRDWGAKVYYETRNEHGGPLRKPYETRVLACHVRTNMISGVLHTLYALAGQPRLHGGYSAHGRPINWNA